MRVISVDVGWKDEGNRNAAVVADGEGRVLAWKSRLDRAGLWDFIKQHAGGVKAVLLDVPIEGCDLLGEKGFRPIDLAISRCGMWALPASKAKQRGVRLRGEVADLVPSATVLEIYPYAIYKFLAFQSQHGNLASLRSHKGSTVPNQGFGAFVPCKYKRAGGEERRRALLFLKELLEHAALGLTFSEPLPAPGGDLSLAHLTDVYDACLGVIAGVFWLRQNPYAQVFGDKDNGEMLLLADEWLAQRIVCEFNKAKNV